MTVPNRQVDQSLVDPRRDPGSGTGSERWLFRPRPELDPRLRLFCVPFAGAGAAAFRTWAGCVGQEVEVCAFRPPGRESRLGDPPHTDVVAMGEEIVEAIHPLLDRPFALFGHSMGALAAYEAVRILARRAESRRPDHLFLSGRRSPRLPNRLPILHDLPDEPFLDAMSERYGGIPDQVRNEPDLLRLLLPCLRADVTAVETHAWRQGGLGDVPVTVLCGMDDPTTLPTEAEAWRKETSGPFAFHLFPGGHFFVDSAREQVLRVVERALTPPRAGGVG